MVTDTQAGQLIAIARAAGAKLPQEDPGVMRRAWALVLAGCTYADAEAALVTVLGRTPWVDVAAVRQEVGRMRRDRLDRCRLPAPNADPDDPVAYAAELRALRDAVANGLMGPEQRAGYETKGLSFTGSHRALTRGPVDPAEVEEGRRALARLGITAQTSNTNE